MTQRRVAAMLAAPLVIALLVLAWLRPLPAESWVTYQPGPTVDVLGEVDDAPIIEVTGPQAPPTYDDDEGQLRMTTVSVTRSETRLDLLTLMGAWLSRQDAVYPWRAVYQQGETDEQSEAEGAVQMVSSQDTAVAVALSELGYDVPPAPEVLAVEPGSPADGRLKVRDVFLEVADEPVTSAQQLVDAISATPAGEAVRVLVRRDGSRKSVRLVPETVDGEQRVGVQIGTGYVFPFEVDVNISPDIGGPSAGLMFALAIYDTLTEGSLGGGAVIAGTGEIAPDGTVRPIGGIQQKIAAADRDGAGLFLVPPDNCADALGADRGDVRLVRAETMHDARLAVEAGAADPDADLPSCEAS